MRFIIRFNRGPCRWANSGERASATAPASPMPVFGNSTARRVCASFDPHSATIPASPIGLPIRFSSVRLPRYGEAISARRPDSETGPMSSDDREVNGDAAT